MGEIEATLRHCAKEKILGPDGWTVEFFLGFWDLVGNEVLEMIEETHNPGIVSGVLNTNFIALIPNNSKPNTFDDFRPISLCNFVYKVITKNIAEIKKPFLARVISREQFYFLPNRQILDAVDIAQEVIHSVKKHNLNA